MSSCKQTVNMLCCWITIDWTVWSPRKKTRATNVTKPFWQGTKYTKNKMIRFNSISVIFVLADLFYFVYGVYEKPMLSFFHDFVVFNILRTCFLFSINAVRPDPLNSPGELSSQCLLFSVYFQKRRENSMVKTFAVY